MLQKTESRFGFPVVKVLSESDIENYELTDLVLPLPGSRVTYPENLKDFYVKLLEEDQLNLEVFDHKVKYVC